MNTLGALLGVISALGFLGFIAGVGLVVFSASQGRAVRGGIILALIGIVVGLLFSVASQGILTLQPQQAAIVFNVLSGELESPPRQAGTSIVVPLVQEYSIYPIDQQQYTMSGIPNEGQVQGDDAVRARTIDGQEIYLDITVIYNIDPAQVNLVHTKWQNRYQDDFIRPTVRGVVREEVTNFRAEEIYGERRTELEDQIQDEMNTRMAAQGLSLTDLLIRDITFSTEFTNSIERKQIAEQAAQEAAFRVQQEEQEAEQIRVRAKGAADAEISKAEGERQSIILRAQGEAEALSLVSAQLAANPLLIQYQYIQSLADNVQLALVPSNTPFLFDFNSLSELPAPNTDFVPPVVPDDVTNDADNTSGN